MPYSGTLTKAHIIEEVAERLTPILTDAVTFIHGVSFLRSHHCPTKGLSGLL